MGSKINIGLVYDHAIKSIAHETSDLLQELINQSARVVYVKYCKDVEGDEWIEIENPILDNHLFDVLAQYHYGQVQIEMNLLQVEGLKLDINVEREEDFFGFLISFEESELLPTYSTETLERVTNSIIRFVSKLIKVTNFDYAFCDHEAKIEYRPFEFKPEKYSISFLPTSSDKTLDVRKSNWHINGLTERQ